MKNRVIEQVIYDNLPEELKKLTENFTGREKDIVLLSSLGVLSTCFPNIKGLYDGDTVYPNLYTLIIAPPASGKGVMNYSRILIEKIHNTILEDSRTEKSECEESKKKVRIKITSKVLVPIFRLRLFPPISVPQNCIRF
ncbi:DUF3987 domain-containing protein [Chryseobacterium sp.]|uniref:DUF3987 domain-containing protein n=1 Tax=Chryseobacterium sp. TaxID=1871047 RepID=UPI0025C5BAF3|nr:DUF3987 domain-containing protein [Chryseobacterium sp.]